MQVNKKILSINSMTGFARYQHEDEHGVYIWEIRTLNHRFRDICFVLPAFVKQAEISIRNKISNILSRGKIDVQLTFIPNSQQFCSISINEKMLDSMKDVVNVMSNKFGETVLPSFDSILNYPGVIVPDEKHTEILHSSIIKSLSLVLDELIQSRSNEGDRLKEFLQFRVTSLLSLVDDLVNYEQQWLGIYRNNLHKKVASFGIDIDENRLEQEIVLLADKMDIAEEICRLKQHLLEFRNVLILGGVVGRKLDFILQEVFREVNTIGSKMSILPVTKIIVDIKVIIEQMREQAQNIE